MKNEELVQRFIDQELAAEERIQFVVALGRDQALRERVLALEQLVLDAEKLPRPIVPEGFAARVLERTAAAKPAAGVVSGFSRTPTWRRLLDAMWAPRALQWNLAGAAAVALIAVGAVVATGVRRPVASVADAPPAGSGPAQAPVVLVRLVVVQPDARVVQAAGDFNGWNPSRTPLRLTAG